MSGTVLVVDNNVEERKRIHAKLAAASYRVLEATTGREAIEQLQRHKADLIIVKDDISMPTSASTIVDRLDQVGVLAPFLVITPRATMDTSFPLMKSGALDCLIDDEPNFLDKLLATVDTTVRGRRRRVLFSWIPLLISIFLAGLLSSVVWHMQQSRDMDIRQRNLLFNLMECSDQAMVILNGNGKIVSWSSGAAAMFGWQPEEVLGEEPTFMMPEEFRDKHNDALAKSTEYQRVHMVDCHAQTKSGKLLHVHIYARTIPNHVGVYHVALINKAENVEPLKQMAAPCPVGATRN